MFQQQFGSILHTFRIDIDRGVRSVGIFAHHLTKAVLINTNESHEILTPDARLQEDAIARHLCIHLNKEATVFIIGLLYLVG